MIGCMIGRGRGTGLGTIGLAQVGQVGSEEKGKICLPD